MTPIPTDGTVGSVAETSPGKSIGGRTRGVAHTVDAVINDTEDVIPCSVPLDGGFGHESVGFCVPAKASSDGIDKFVEWEVDEFEQAQMQEAADKLSDQYENIS